MNKKKPDISSERISNEFDSRFIKIYGMQYFEGKKYMNASRRTADSLVAVKSDEEFKKMTSDAVSCVVILNEEEPKLLLTYEYRYPIGKFLLSVPAGLLDKEDEESDNPVISSALRELKEEANLELTKEDSIGVVNPVLFSSPGMTDESNALVSVVVNGGRALNLNQDGAEGGECFEGFVMLNKEEAKKILMQGTDDNGIFYSVYTFAALMYFLSDMWKQNN